MSTDPTTFLTEEQYLEIERKAETKSEYFRGEMFAMSGASEAHLRMVRALTVSLTVQLRSSKCEIFSTDCRVRVNATGLYTYPDIVGVCGQPEWLRRDVDTLVNPVFLAEVLSPSTEAYDRGRKFDHYKTIPSLREYLLVSTDRIHVDLLRRGPEGLWILSSADSREESLEIESLGCRLSLAELYERVEL